MNTAYANTPVDSLFANAYKHLELMICHLVADRTLTSEHSEIEQFINKQGTELLRLLLQSHLELRAKK